MRDYYAHILRNWIYPFSQRVMKRDYSRMLSAAQKNQFLSQDELQDLQFRKLTALLHHAYRTVPYYRETFDQAGIAVEDIRSREDFKKLPLLTKSAIRPDPGRFISSQPRTPVYPIRTSGSTGTPLFFTISQAAAAAANISRMRALNWWGIELGDRMLRVYNTGNTLEQNRWTPVKKGILRFFRDRLMNRRTFDGNDFSPANIERLWRFVQSYRPRYMFSYPSVFYNFALYLQKQGYDGRSLRIRAAVCSSEVLYDRQEEVIRETFGCPVADEYGTSEVGLLSYSYPCGEIHTMDDFMIVEVVKSNPGDQFGEVVITQLENWGSPLIRYNLEDLAVPDGESGQCPLGLGFSKIRVVVGKELDLIHLPDGRAVHGQFLANLMFRVRSIRKFQVVQKALDQLEIDIIPASGRIPPEDEEYLMAAIRKYLGPFNVQLRTVSEIPDEPSGKFRAVKSDLNQSTYRGV